MCRRIRGSARPNNFADHRSTSGAMFFQETMRLTSCNCLGETQSNKPPLVCASANKRRKDCGMLFQTVISFAFADSRRVHAGTQSRRISEKISAADRWHGCDGNFRAHCRWRDTLQRGGRANQNRSHPQPRARARSARLAPTKFSWHMSVIVLRARARVVTPRLIPVVAIPVPSGFVRTADRRRVRARSSACASATPGR